MTTNHERARLTLIAAVHEYVSEIYGPTVMVPNLLLLAEVDDMTDSGDESALTAVGDGSKYAVRGMVEWWLDHERATMTGSVFSQAMDEDDDEYE